MRDGERAGGQWWVRETGRTGFVVGSFVIMAADVEKLVPDRRLSLDGQVVAPEMQARISRICVDMSEDLFNQCTILLTDPDLSLINGGELTAGVGVFVELGYIGKLVPVFDGEIVSVEPRFVRDKPPSIVIRALERLHRLALAPNTRSFQDADAAQVVKALAQENGLSSDAPSGSKGHFLQANVTDFQVLRKIASRTGTRISLEGKKLVLGPPPSFGELELLPDSGLKRLKVKLRTTEQVPKVIVRGWDPRQKKEIVGQASPKGELGDGAKEAKTFDRGDYFIEGALVQDMAEAELIAQAAVNRISERFATAEGEIPGAADLSPGKILAFDKWGELLDGKYRVTESQHEFDKRGYRVRFKASRVAKKKSTVPFKAPAPAPETAAAVRKATEAAKVKPKADLDAARRATKRNEQTAVSAKKGLDILKKVQSALESGNDSKAKQLFGTVKQLHDDVMGAVDTIKKYAKKAEEIAQKSEPDLKAIYETGKSAADDAAKHAEKISKSFGEAYRAIGAAVEEFSSR